jgi:hypothetical protein
MRVDLQYRIQLWVPNGTNKSKAWTLERFVVLIYILDIVDG